MMTQKNVNQYLFVIGKIRAAGGLNFSKPATVKMAQMAEAILIESGVIAEANRGRFLFISTHVAYEEDAIRFCKNNM